MKKVYVMPTVKMMCAVTKYQVLAVSGDMTIGSQDLGLDGIFGGGNPGDAL